MPRSRGIFCSNGYEGVKILRWAAPGIALVDLRMPEINGIMTLKILQENNAKPQVIFLTTSDAATDLKECLEINANGYLLKDMNPGDLVVALKKATTGEVVIAPELAQTLTLMVQNWENGLDSTGKSPSTLLNTKELEIMQHVTAEQSNKVIAKHVCTSDSAVKLHVKSMLEKLGLKPRVEAAVMAVSHGVFK